MINEPTILNDNYNLNNTTIIHNPENIVISTSLETNEISKESRFLLLIGSNLETYFQKEFNYNTNILIKVNNEDFYEEIIKNVLQNYDISKEEERIFKGEDNYYFHLTTTN